MSSAVCRVVLPRIVDLDAIGAVRDLLRDGALAGDVTVDGSAVERVSTNGLLLVLAGAAEARAAGREMTLAAPSATLQAAIATLGLTTAFAGITA